MGCGVVQDRGQAYKWLLLGQSFFLTEARATLAGLKSSLRGDQTAAIEKLVEKWEPTEWIASDEIADPVVPGVDGITLPELNQATKIKPDYPEPARIGRATAQLILQAVIAESGKVAEAFVLTSSNPRLGFEEAALEAIRQWTYQPAMRDGQPVDVMFTIRVDFELQ